MITAIFHLTKGIKELIDKISVSFRVRYDYSRGRRLSDWPLSHWVSPVKSLNKLMDEKRVRSGAPKSPWIVASH